MLGRIGPVELILLIIVAVVVVVLVTVIKGFSRSASAREKVDSIKHSIKYCRNCSEEVELGKKYCSNCGFAPLNGDNYCQQCGIKTQKGQGMCTSCGFKLLSSNSLEVRNTDHDSGMFILGLLLPIVGLIIYLIFNESQPGKAKSAGKGALWGVSIGFILWIFIVASL